MIVRRRGWLLKWFICLTAGVIIACWAARCEAYEPWKGQVTVRVNVRQAPGRTSPVVTQIDEGVAVTVSDEKEGWYKVIVEEDTFGFIGWVYGKYVKDPTALSTTSPSSEVREKTETLPSKPATLAATHAAPIESAPKERPEGGGNLGEGLEKSASADVKTSPGIGERGIVSEVRTERAEAGSRHPLPKKSVVNEDADLSEIGKAMGEGRVHSREVPPQKAKQEVDKHHASIQDQSSSAAAMSHAAPLQKEAALPVNKLNMPSAKGEPAVGIPQEKAPAETGRAVGRDSKRESGWGAVMGVVVKLVVVAFSCLALIFAYRAWQITSTRSKD